LRNHGYLFILVNVNNVALLVVGAIRNGVGGDRGEIIDAKPQCQGEQSKGIVPVLRKVGAIIKSLRPRTH
jgi:hypothetical protein